MSIINSFIWNGTGFSSPSPPLLSQFFSDPKGAIYYYDQNYNGLFPVSLVNGSPSYLGTTFEPILVAPNTTLTPLPQYSTSLIAVYGQIINGRFADYASTPSNMLNNFVQSPSTLVANTVSQSATAMGIGSAINSAASVLTNPQLNFIFNDIVGNWKNGSITTQQIFSWVSLYQGYLAKDLGKIQAIVDFKKKVLNIQTQVANELGTVQQQLSGLQQTGTFTQLASAFPTAFGGINQIFSNVQSTAEKELAQILPTSGLPPNIQAFINIQINNLFGGLIRPVIANTADKLLSDINTLKNLNLNAFSFSNIAGFAGGFLGANNFVNQALNLLDNITASLPVAPTVPIPAANTNPLQIFKSVADYAALQLNLNAHNQLSPLQEVLANTVGSAVNTINNASAGTNLATGGTLLNSSPLSDILPDPTVLANAPSLFGSQDFAVNQSSYGEMLSQNKANAAGILENAAEGDCINNLTDVPLRPRAVSITGTQGDYQTSVNIPI